MPFYASSRTYFMYWVWYHTFLIHSRKTINDNFTNTISDIIKLGPIRTRLRKNLFRSSRHYGVCPHLKIKTFVFGLRVYRKLIFFFKSIDRSVNLKLHINLFCSEAEWSGFWSLVRLDWMCCESPPALVKWNFCRLNENSPSTDGP